MAALAACQDAQLPTTPVVPSGPQAAVVPTAELTWAPTTGTDVYDFGTLTPGQTLSQAFTLTNTGRRSSGTLSVELAGSSAFTITADACTGSALGGGQSCGVSVLYSATAAGQSDQATLTATGEHGVSASVTLTGAAVPPTHIYWTNITANTIGRANLDGTNADQSFITGAGGPGGVAVDGTHIYWTNTSSNTIGRANLDGTGVDQSFITTASSPAGVAVDGTHVCWTNTYSTTIGRANLDGTGADQSFITGTSYAWAIAVGQ